jgi:pre-mRNA-splicing factor 38A
MDYGRTGACLQVIMKPSSSWQSHFNSTQFSQVKIKSFVTTKTNAAVWSQFIDSFTSSSSSSSSILSVMAPGGANESDPLATRLSGTDPQSLLEYITRQRIYDSRYWKEECFGLTTAHVLEKAAVLSSMGGWPHHLLCLLLKLLQLHPEHEMIRRAFCDQNEFKYVRALGALYIRLTSRPVEIYESLEPLLHDNRALRVWVTPRWSTIHMDEYIDSLLQKNICWTMALPRLPARRFLEEAGYLEPERPTALRSEEVAAHGGLLKYLRHLALVEQHPAAMAAWAKRGGDLPAEMEAEESSRTSATVFPRPEYGAADSVVAGPNNESTFQEPALPPPQQQPPQSETDLSVKKPKKKKAKKEQGRNYNNLFKKPASSSKTKKGGTGTSAGPEQPEDHDVNQGETSTMAVEGSDEYWNEQRAKLGLGKLK